jgi:hypothetical protein
MAAEQIVQMLGGVRPPRLVNPEVWDVFMRRREALLNAVSTV